MGAPDHPPRAAWRNSKDDRRPVTSDLPAHPAARKVRGVFRPLPALALFAVLTAGLIAGEAPPPAGLASTAPDGRFARVTVEPAKTSIFIGSVTLTLLPLARQPGVYEADYAAKVFPFFFYNEHGRFSIRFSDDNLRQLQRGEAVSFTGQAHNSGGGSRRIEGRAVPDAPDATRGKLKVRVWVGRIELIFNTVYQFSGGD